MWCRFATLFSRRCRDANKKVESDGTAGGVLGEECRAVLLLVFWGGAGNILYEKIPMKLQANLTG